MRFLILICLSWGLTAHAQNDLLQDIRKNIGEVFENEDVCLKMYNSFTDTDVSDNNLLVGYKGGVLMGMARHRGNPFKKMWYFNDGKDLLEASISKDPESIEIRFLRLTIQTNLPAFLGYHHSKLDDKKFVQDNLDKVSSELLRERMRNFITKAEKDGKL